MSDVTTRYNFRKNEEQSDESLQKLQYEDLISRALPFYSSVAEAIKAICGERKLGTGRLLSHTRLSKDTEKKQFL